MTFCANCKVFQERAGEAGRKLQEQEARFQKAKTDFEARAKQIIDSQAQHARVIAQLREDARQAREDRDGAIAAAGGRRYLDDDEEMGTLRAQVASLKSELQDKTNRLDLAQIEVEKLKGKPAEKAYDENDPFGTIGRLLQMEID